MPIRQKLDADAPAEKIRFLPLASAMRDASSGVAAAETFTRSAC